MKKIEDYLNFYIGCPVEFGYGGSFYKGSRNIGKLEGYDPRFGWIVFVPSNVMAPYKVVRTELIKPILRPLSDMTDEEKDFFVEGDKRYVLFDTDRRRTLDAYRTHYLLSHHFDIFGFIELGLAIDKTTLK